jgi:hypothetical protein
MINKIQNLPNQNTMPAYQNKTKPSFGQGFCFLAKLKKIPLNHFQEFDFLDYLYNRIKRGEFKFLENEKSSRIYLSDQNDKLVVNTKNKPASIEFYPCSADVISGLNVEILSKNMSDYVSSVYDDILKSLERLNA